MQLPQTYFQFQPFWWEIISARIFFVRTVLSNLFTTNWIIYVWSICCSVYFYTLLLAALSMVWAESSMTDAGAQFNKENQGNCEQRNLPKLYGKKKRKSHPDRKLRTRRHYLFTKLYFKMRSFSMNLFVFHLESVFLIQSHPDPFIFSRRLRLRHWYWPGSFSHIYVNGMWIHLRSFLVLGVVGEITFIQGKIWIRIFFLYRLGRIQSRNSSIS